MEQLELPWHSKFSELVSEKVKRMLRMQTLATPTLNLKGVEQGRQLMIDSAKEVLYCNLIRVEQVDRSVISYEKART